MMKYGIGAFIVVALLALAVGFFGCGKKGSNQLIVGTESNFPPYEYHDGQQLTGIDLEIMQIAAKKLGKELVVEELNFDTILDAVRAGRVDVGAAAISVSPARQELVDFTDSYDKSQLVAVVPLRSPLHDASDLKGKLVGVQRGSSSDEFVTKNIQQPSRFTDVETAFQNLMDGRLDAVVVDSEPAKLQLCRSKKLRILKLDLSQEEYAFAVRKGRNDSLRQRLNIVIRELKKSGKIAELKEKHEKKAAALGLAPVPKPLLHIAIDPTFPPIGYVHNGKPMGIEIDLLDIIAKDMNRIADYEQVGFDAMFEIVAKDNQVSIGAGSVSITEERAKLVDFSIPYFETHQHLYVRSDSPIQGIKDLQGKRFGAIHCTTGEAYLRQYAGEPECYSESELLFRDLARGDLDAIIMDEDPAEVFMMQYKNVKKLPEILLKEQYGFIVRKENRELLEQINDTLLRLQSDGTLQQIRDKHFRRFHKERQ